MPNDVINALCIDADDLASCVHESGRRVRNRRYNAASETHAVLEQLDQLGIKATFFIPGHFLSGGTDLIRSMVSAGHEIASHGSRHSPVGHFSPGEFLEDVSASKKVLEDLSGRAIEVYKAPIWSITIRCAWAYDVLLEAGFRVDNSPWPRLVEHLGQPSGSLMPFLYADQLLLIPVTSTRFLGFDLPFPGGFYNAYVPLMLQRRVYDGINRRGLPFNLYFHPYEHSPAGHNRSLVKYRSLYMSLYAAHLGRYATLLPRITARYRMGTLLQAYARWLPKQP